MPKIPTYDSQATLRAETLRTGKLTEEAPAIRIPEGSFAGETQALGELGKTLGKIGENIYALQAQEELSKANIAVHQGRLQIENTEDAETQGWLERRNKEIQDLRANTLKGIRNPLAKREFEAEFDNDIIDTQFRLKKAYTGLTVDKVKTALYQERETAEQEIFAGINDQRKQARIDKIGKRYSQLARLGGMKQDVALKEFREWQVGLKEGQAEHDILGNPVYALGELQKGKQGAYVGLAQDKRIDLIKQAESRIEKIKNQQEEAIAIAQNQKESDLIDLKIAGTLTEQQVKVERQTGIISAKFADTMISALRNPKVYKPTALESIVKFNELVERNMSIAKREKAWFGIGRVPFEEMAKFRADVMDANARGYISDKQTTDLLSETSKTFYRDPIFQNTLDQLVAQSKLYATSEAQARAKAEMYGNLITKVIAGKEPREAVVEVIKERLNTELGEAVKIVEEGNRIFAKKGKQRIYSEDGGITWKDEATGKEIE